MATCNLKNPPKLEEGASYEAWRRDVKLWTKLTDLAATKQAIAIYLSLGGQSRILASEIPEDDLLKATGVDTLLNKLDTLHLEDKELRQFSAFHKLYNLRRNPDMAVGTFISEFEHVYYDFKRYEMELPDSVQSFILLSACNLSESERKLVMSGLTGVTYQGMKEALRRIFATEIGNNSAECAIKSEPIFQSNDENKDESALYTNNNRGNWRNKRGHYSRGGRFSSMQSRGSRTSGSHTVNAGSYWNKQQQNFSHNGKTQRCFGCGSRFHFLKDCLDKDKNNVQSNSENEVIHLSLFNRSESDKDEVLYENKKLDNLVAESFGHAVIDTGCSSTVCGSKWLDQYVEQLSEYDRSMIVELPSKSSFTFGDGAVINSNKKIEIPCYLGGKRSKITTDVVDCNIPLLLSKRSMKSAEMVLDFKSDTAVIGNMTNKLSCSTSGHYMLPIAF